MKQILAMYEYIVTEFKLSELKASRFLKIKKKSAYESLLNSVGNLVIVKEINIEKILFVFSKSFE
jgi:hypothetical protein